MKQPSNSSLSRNVIALVALGLIVAVTLLVVVMRRANTVTTQTSTSSSTAAQLQAGKVDITATGFVPSTITVKVGDTVTWTNQDKAQHQIAADPYPLENGLAGFRSASPTAETYSYAFTFKKAGTYTYHDHLNPLKLKGTVIVQ